MLHSKEWKITKTKRILVWMTKERTLVFIKSLNQSIILIVRHFFFLSKYSHYIDCISNLSLAKSIYDSESEFSGRITEKKSHKVNLNDYSSPFVLPNNHLKLTKIKREINSYRSKWSKIAEDNKLKVKEKKRLEEKIKLLNDEISELLNGNNHTDATESEHVSIGYTEQKGIKATSTCQDWSMYYLHYIYQQMLILLNLDEEEGKQVLEEVLKGSLSSSVGESTVWHNLNDKKRSTVSSMKPLMLDKIEDHSFEDRVLLV